MQRNGLTSFIYRISEWIMLLAYVNILWIFFTVIGVVVLGVFPATAGLFGVVRQWILKGNDISVWKTFWGVWRKELLKANILGYIFALIGAAFYFDIRFFQFHGGLVGLFLYYLLLIAFILYFVMGIFLFPVFVHYDLKVSQYLKQTFFIVMLRPLEVILSAVLVIGVYYLMMKIPGLIPFFSMSLTAFVAMFAANRAFKKISSKNEQTNQTV